MGLMQRFFFLSDNILIGFVFIFWNPAQVKENTMRPGLKKRKANKQTTRLIHN